MSYIDFMLDFCNFSLEVNEQNLYLPFVAPIEASFESSSEKVSETLIGDHIGKGYGYFCETVV